MSAPSKILLDGDSGRLLFWCPGCDEEHVINHGPGGWTWNGNASQPTFSPSVLVSSHKITKDADGKWTGGWERDAQGKPIPTVCHTFVTDGRIQFLNDCTHALAGQTIDLPDYPSNAD